MEVTLLKGLAVGNDVYKTANIAPLTNGDVIDANLESEQLEMVPEMDASGVITGYRPEYVKSATLVGLHTLRRQLSIGVFEAPLEMETLRLLDPLDMNLIQQAANAMDAAALQASEAVAQRGRTDSDSTEH